jgi:hypothetical protein
MLAPFLLSPMFAGNHPYSAANLFGRTEYVTSEGRKASGNGRDDRLFSASFFQRQLERMLLSD